MDSDVRCPFPAMCVRKLDANFDGALIKSARRHNARGRRNAERAFFLFHGHTGAEEGS
jgi:hypothetical protein